jgi:hypothetical protein
MASSKSEQKRRRREREEYIKETLRLDNEKLKEEHEYLMGLFTRKIARDEKREK